MLNESNIPLEEDGIEEEILVEDELTITKAMWGDIGGNIENQTDLQNALDAKQDDLTEAQLNAVNSGITAEKVTTYDGYADQIASKADQSALNAESIARGEADTALGTRIDDEALARQQADNGLQSQIDAITSKSDVVDVVANYAALQAYGTSSLSDNDVIKVLDDETHEDALTYYRWSTTTQTWSYIGQEAPYYSKGQMNVMLQGKQDKLTAGANIQIQNGTISATDTTYTNGNGLNLNGTEFSADTTVLATKSDLDNYYTKTETDTKLAPKLEAEVVAELPATGTEGKLYLTPKAHTTQTATGNPITATVAEDAGAIESFQLDGDTAQNSYTGKNLFNKVNYLNNTFINASTSEVGFGNGFVTIYAQVSPSTEYTISKLSTSRFIVAETTQVPAVGDTVTVISGTAQTSEVKTVTTGTNASYLAIMVKSSSDTLTIEQILGSIQIEAGSTATAYEPYVGGTPSPNPEYPQPIQTVTGLQTVELPGKNIFNPSAAHFITGQIESNKTLNTSSGSTVWIPCAPNTTYTLSKSSTTRTMIGTSTELLDSTNTLTNLVLGDSSTPSGRQYGTITSGPNDKYMYITYSEANNIAPSVVNIQIEVGSTVSDYEGYHATSYPLDLGSIELCKLGDYQDYIWKDGDDWKVHKAIKKSVFDQNSRWTKNQYGTNAYNIKTGDIFTAVAEIGVISPQFIAKSYNNRTDATSNIIFADSNDGMSIESRGITIRNTAWSDLTSFIAWVTSNPVTAYYVLATPTDTAITDTDLIAQLEAIRTASLQNGTNTITNTATGSNLAGDMEIGYYGYNPRNRYDKWLWLDINNEYEQIGS